jgi:group I intron endonuclease
MTTPTKLFADVPEAPGIYQIRCLVDDKVYVGQSVNLRTRLLSHRCRLRKGQGQNPRLQNAWNRHGEHNFRFHVVETCSTDLLTAREARFMALLDTHNPTEGYNIAKAARVYTYGAAHYPETVRKIQATKRANGHLRLITVDGKTQTMAEWARAAGISVSLLGFRVRKNPDNDNDNLRRAVTEPSRQEKYVIDGVGKSLPQWSKVYAVPYGRVISRVRKGWHFIDALTVPRIDLRRPTAPPVNLMEAA